MNVDMEWDLEYTGMRKPSCLYNLFVECDHRCAMCGWNPRYKRDLKLPEIIKVEAHFEYRPSYQCLNE